MSSEVRSSNSNVLAHLEDLSRRLSEGDVAFRSLPKVFDFALAFEEELSPLSGNEHKDDSHPPLPIRPTSVQSMFPSSVMSHTARNEPTFPYGLQVLKNAYDDECNEYLEKGGVYELLDFVAVSNVSCSAVGGCGSGAVATTPQQASSSPPASPSKKPPVDDGAPLLSLVRSVEQYRLAHPIAGNSLDVVHERASQLARALNCVFQGKELVLLLESLWVVRYPTSPYTGALPPANRGGVAPLSAAALQSSPSTVASGAEDPLATTSCCGFVLNAQLEDLAESAVAKIKTMDRMITDLADTLSSIDGGEKALQRFSWSQGLNTPSKNFLLIPVESMKAMVQTMLKVVKAAQRTYSALKELMHPGKNWILCLNDNLTFLKRETSCEGVPKLMEEVSTYLSGILSDCASPQLDTYFPSLMFVLGQGCVVRDASWALHTWKRTRPYLQFLQRLLIAQIETFTIVMVPSPDGSGAEVPMRQITVTPTTRLDRIYSERRSVLAWGALCMRSSFHVWEDLRDAPLHRVAQQLKKLQLDKKTAFEVQMILLGAQLDLGCGPEGGVPNWIAASGEEGGAAGRCFEPHCRVVDFLDEEMTMFFFERRNVKFTSATVTRK